MTEPTAVPAPPPSAEKRASFWEDFIDILYAPSTVYARRAHANFWLPLLIISVLAGVFVFVNRGYYSAVFDAEFHRGVAKAMASNPQLTQEMVDQGRPIQEKIARIFGYLATPIVILLVGLITWIATKITSVKLTVEQAMLVVTLAYIPRILEQVVLAAQNLFLDINGVNSMFSYSLNVARFLDPDATNGKLYGLAGRLDLFTLWVTFLIAVGVATIARVPRAKGYATAAVVFAIGSLPVLFR